MLIGMQKEVFDSLPDEKIGHACFEPMIPVYQNGIRNQSSQDAQEFKAEFYKSLSPGQRALFGFFSFFDHAVRSEDEFQRITNLYLSGRFFAIVKNGAEYFGVKDMRDLLLDIEKTHTEHSEEQNYRVDELYGRLCEIAPQTLKQIGVFIKENPSEFVSFT